MISCHYRVNGTALYFQVFFQVITSQCQTLRHRENWIRHSRTCQGWVQFVLWLSLSL